MGGEYRGIEFTPLHVLEQPGEIALPVLLRGADRQTLVGHGAHRELVGHPVDPEHGDHSALAAGEYGLPQ